MMSVSFMHEPASFLAIIILNDLGLRNETYRKVLKILGMKNYAAVVAKLQSRTVLCFDIILQHVN